MAKKSNGTVTPDAAVSKKTLKAAKKAAKQSKAISPGEETSAKKSGVLTNPIRNLILTALVFIVLGAAFIAKPIYVYTYCCYVIGGLIGLIGIVYLIIYFVRRPVSGVYRSEFAVGLVVLLAGAYVAFSSLISDDLGVSTISFSLAVIVRLLGILIAADGILKLQYTLDLARMRYAKWWIGLILSALGIAVGVLTTLGIIYSLGDTLGTSGMTMLGIFFILNGVFDLFMMVLVAVRNRKANKAEALALAQAMTAAAAGGEPVGFTPTVPEANTSAPDKAAPSETVPSDPPAPEPVPEQEEPQLPNPAAASPVEE